MLRRLVRIINHPTCTQTFIKLHPTKRAEQRTTSQRSWKSRLLENVNIRSLDVIRKYENIATNLRELRAERAPSVELSFRHRPVKECKKERKEERGRVNRGKLSKVIFVKPFSETVNGSAMHDNMGHISLNYNVKVQGGWWVRYDRWVRIQKERNGRGKECFHLQGGGAEIFSEATFSNRSRFFLVE